MSKKIFVGALSMALAGSVFAQATFPDAGFYGFGNVIAVTQHTSANWNGDTRNW